MKKVIYTAVTGNYDQINQPKIVSDEFDYVLYTDCAATQNIGKWQVRQIPYDNKDNTRRARWVKTHPHLLFHDYEVSVWIDSNIVFDYPNFYTRLNRLIEDKKLISSFDHNVRDCIYEEAFSVITQLRDSINLILKEVLYLKENSYPRHNGLCETNIVLRFHNHPSVKKHSDDWWSMINKYSRRDQLSFNYVLWANKLSVTYILPPKENSRNHYEVHCESHNKSSIKDYIWRRFLLKKYERSSNLLYKRIINSKYGSIPESLFILLFKGEYYLFLSLLYISIIGYIMIKGRNSSIFSSIR